MLAVFVQLYAYARKRLINYMHPIFCFHIYLLKCTQCLKCTFFIYFLFLNSNNKDFSYFSLILKNKNCNSFFIISLKILVCH